MAKEIDTYYGVPITNHDLQGQTDARERRGYRILEYVTGGLILIFALMGLLRVPSDLGPGVWWAMALLCAGYFFTFFPIAFPRKRVTRPQGTPQGQFNQQRLDSFWYERDMADNTDEEIIDRDEPVIPPDEDDRPLP